MHAIDTTWVLVSAALVLFMTPGLALFYGGMVRSKNVLSVMMNNFVAMGLVSVLWALIACSLVFGHDVGHGLIGDFSLAGLGGTGQGLAGFGHSGASPLAVVTFQMMFAVITAALISGGTTDRIKFPAFVLFITCWLFLVYVPLAHWVFSPDGWLAHRGVLDFAGGTVVEINSGFSTLAIVLVLGRATRVAERGDGAALRSPQPARGRHPVVRLVRVQRRLGTRDEQRGGVRIPQHRTGRSGRTAGLAVLRAHPRGLSDDIGRRVGSRRRHGGHHAVRGVRLPDGVTG